jgi:hypothetical protein
MTSESDVDARGSEGDEFLDDAYQALSRSRRRQLLAALRDADRPVSVAALARRIVAREEDVPESSVQDGAVQDVYLSLYHADLPKLADVGAVRVDRDRNVVSPGENFDAVYSLLAVSG